MSVNPIVRDVVSVSPDNHDSSTNVHVNFTMYCRGCSKIWTPEILKAHDDFLRKEDERWQIWTPEILKAHDDFLREEVERWQIWTPEILKAHDDFIREEDERSMRHEKLREK